MRGVITQINVDGTYVLGVGYTMDDAKNNLYSSLYNIYDDRKAEEVSIRIRRGNMQVVKDVGESVLFYATFCHNGEDMTEKHVRKLEQRFEETNLEDKWGNNWREKLKDEGVKID